MRATYAANLARGRDYRFAVVLPEGRSQFEDTLRAALSEAAGALSAERVTTRIVGAPAHDAHAFAAVLDRLDRGTLDGVAVMARETPQVRDAVARLKKAGIAVVALVSDLPSSERDFFIGINSLQAGRTAAILMGRFLPARVGKVLVVTDSLLSRDSIERRLGFDRVMAEAFPHLVVLPTVESFDDAGRVRTIVAAAAAPARGDLVGVYSMGSQNKAVLEGVRAAGRAEELVVIAHELTPFTRAALETGEIDAVITQNAGHLARSALRVLRATCDGTGIFEAQERLRIDIVIRENLP